MVEAVRKNHPNAVSPKCHGWFLIAVSPCSHKSRVAQALWRELIRSEFPNAEQAEPSSSQSLSKVCRFGHWQPGVQQTWTPSLTPSATHQQRR